MPSLDFLRKIDIFKGLSEDQLVSIQARCHQKDYLKGKKLFEEGEDAAQIFVVVKGQVDLCFDLPAGANSEVSTLSAISPANSFGWSSFVPPYKYRLSAYCASGMCSVLRLDKEYLLTLFEKDFRMGYVVMSNLAAVIDARFQQLQKSATASPYSLVKVKVHMATCGIAAGAREVMTALMDELSRSGRHDIQVETSGCIGKCSTEPNVTVEIGGEEPVVYQKMNPDKMRRVFDRHVLKGEIQSDFVLV